MSIKPFICIGSILLASAALPVQEAKPLLYERVTVSYDEEGLPRTTMRLRQASTSEGNLARLDTVLGASIIRGSKASGTIQVWNSESGELKTIKSPSTGGSVSEWVVGLFPGVSAGDIEKVASASRSLGTHVVNGKTCTGIRLTSGSSVTDIWSLEVNGVSFNWYTVTKESGVITDVSYGVRLDEATDADMAVFEIPK